LYEVLLCLFKKDMHQRELAKEFNMKIRAYKDNLNNKEINNIREEFLKI
jgi:hypothetical protein